MIQKININNFGSLINFSNAQNEFTPKNAIIHGMNGSGKSQICSMLQQIEKIKNIKELDQTRVKEAEESILKYVGARKSKESGKAIIIDMKIDKYNIGFDIKRNKITEKGNIPDVFVFNDDYINENIGNYLNIHDREIRIGQKNVQRDNLIREAQDKEAALRNINEQIDKMIKEARYESGYYNQTRTKKIISKENYLAAANPGVSYPNGKNELNNLSDPPEAITEHYKYGFPSLSLDVITKKTINEVLTKAYIEPVLTQEFYKTYLSVRKNFFEDGVLLFNESKEVCPFCLTPKSADDTIIHELINYLNSDFNEKLHLIQSLIGMFEQNKKNLEKSVFGLNNLIPIIREKSKNLGIVKKIEEINIDDDIFNNCIELLRTKSMNMDKAIDSEQLAVFEEYESYINNINILFSQYNEKVEKINNSIKKIGSLKCSLGKKIIENQMFILWNKTYLRERYEELTKEIERLKSEIDASSNLISNNRIPDFFNQIIKILGITKYELNKESLLILKLENDFDISAEGYRISAGERKIIAFSYFLSEVIASAGSYTELPDKTIIIDDPIDNSDYDKFYSFISAIENFDKILVNIFNNNAIKFGQIFIFTHSAILYERLCNNRNFDSYLLSSDNNKTNIKKRDKLPIFR